MEGHLHVLPVLFKYLEENDSVSGIRPLDSLFLAAYFGRYQVVKDLLTRDEFKDVQSGYYNPLMAALKGGDKATIEILLTNQNEMDDAGLYLATKKAAPT